MPRSFVAPPRAVSPLGRRSRRRAFAGPSKVWFTFSPYGRQTSVVRYLTASLRKPRLLINVAVDPSLPKNFPQTVVIFLSTLSLLRLRFFLKRLLRVRQTGRHLGLYYSTVRFLRGGQALPELFPAFCSPFILPPQIRDFLSCSFCKGCFVPPFLYPG